MELLNKKQIFLNLDVTSNITTKSQLFKFIGEKARDLGIATNSQKVYMALQEREEAISTGLEDGFAIPHCQSDAIIRSALIFIKLTKKLAHKIAWETLDQQPAQYVFVILVPKSTINNAHLSILSQIASMLSQPNIRSQIKLLNTKKEIIRLFHNRLIPTNKEVAAVEDHNVDQSAATNHVSPPPSNSVKKVVGITSCPVGIAHTYLAADKLIQALVDLGYQPKIETQGSVGVKNHLTAEDIAAAEFVIIAADVEIDLARFDNKIVYQTSTQNAIKDPAGVINEAAHARVYHHMISDNSNMFKAPKDHGILKHIVTGISYMIPYVIFGGIMIALALGIGKSIYGSASQPPQYDFLWYMLQLGVISFHLMIGALGAYIAYSIAGRAAIMPGFVVSTVANSNDYFYRIGNLNVDTPLGFIGSILFGILVGYSVKFIIQLKIQKSISAIVPMFIIPIGISLFYSLLVIFVIGAPIGFVLNKFKAALETVFSSKHGSLGIGLSIAIGGLLGGMIGFDMGGPVNKVAFLTSTGLVTQGILAPMGMVGAAIPVAPLGMGLATLLFRHKFDSNQKSLGLSALIMGFIGISEGAIPFAVSDPKRVITANIIGSIVAGAIAGGLSVTNAASHGGPIVAILGAVGSSVYSKGLGILYYFVAILCGMVITALIYGFWKDHNLWKPRHWTSFKMIKPKWNLSRGR